MLRLDKKGPKQTMLSLIVNDDLFFFLDAEGLRRFRKRYGILNNNTTKQSSGFFDRVKHS